MVFRNRFCPACSEELGFIEKIKHFLGVTSPSEIVKRTPQDVLYQSHSNNHPSQSQENLWINGGYHHKIDPDEAIDYLEKAKNELVGHRVKVTVDSGRASFCDLFPELILVEKSIDSSRLAIRYAEDGGREKDGLIEIRRGVEDLSFDADMILDWNHAKMRLLVDNTHYIKGMAKYSDDIPDGYDVLFYTHKSRTKSKLDVLKPLK